MYFTALNYVTLRCTALRCAALYCTVLYCTERYYTKNRIVPNHILDITSHLIFAPLLSPALLLCTPTSTPLSLAVHSAATWLVC